MLYSPVISLSIKLYRTKIVMKNKQVILALDVASITGFAIYKSTSERIVHLGVVNFGITNDRPDNLRKWLLQMIGKYKINLIVAEQAIKMSNKPRERYTYKLLSGFCDVIKQIAKENKIPSVFYTPIEARNIVFGYGFNHGAGRKSIKQYVVAYVNKMGFDIRSNDDMADAVVIMQAYLKENGKSFGLPKDGARLPKITFECRY